LIGGARRLGQASVRRPQRRTRGLGRFREYGAVLIVAARGNQNVANAITGFAGSEFPKQ
jgi:hypothetical protein